MARTPAKKKQRVRGPNKTVDQKKIAAKTIDDREKKIDAGITDVQKEAANRRRDAKNAHKKMGGLQGQRMVAPQREGFNRRWVNDNNKGNIDRMLNLGYYFLEENEIGDEFIPTSNLGKRKSIRVGTQEDGSVLNAYLMEQPLEFYKENQQEKEGKILQTEDQIRSGEPQGKGVDKAYNPSPGSNNINV